MCTLTEYDFTIRCSTFFYTFGTYFSTHSRITLENIISNNLAPDTELCHLLYENLKSKETLSKKGH
jgi:hypothetical protein